MNLLFTVGLSCLAGLAAMPAAGRAALPQYRIVSRTVLGKPGSLISAEYLTIDSAAGRLYIGGAQMVAVVDVRTRKLIGTIPQSERVGCIALAPDRKLGYATLWQPNEIAVIDLRTMKTVETINTQTEFSAGLWPKAIVYEPKTHRLFTMNESSSDCTVIDARKYAVLRHIPLGGLPGFAVADGKGMVYANITQTNEMVAIDARTMAVTKRWPLVGGEGPTGLAMDTRHRRLFSTCANGKVVVSDPDQGKVTAAVSLAKGAVSAVYDARNGLLFCPNGGEGTITAIPVRGPDAFATTSTIPTLYGAHALALDTRTHHLFAIASTAPETPGPYSGPGVPTLLELAPR